MENVWMLSRPYQNSRPRPISWHLGLKSKTKSSAVAERPRDAPCRCGLCRRLLGYVPQGHSRSFIQNYNTEYGMYKFQLVLNVIYIYKSLFAIRQQTENIQWEKKEKRKERQTRTHNVNSRTISGKNHTSIICQSSQPKQLTFTNARIQIMQHWMLTVDVL